MVINWWQYFCTFGQLKIWMQDFYLYFTLYYYLYLNCQWSDQYCQLNTNVKLEFANISH